MRKNLIRLLLMVVLAIGLQSCGVSLNMPITQGVVKDDFTMKINVENKQINIAPNRFFTLDSMNIIANEEPLSVQSKTLLSCYTDGNIGYSRLMEHIYDVTLRKGDKSYYGKIAFFKAPSSAKNQGVTSYYQIAIANEYFGKAIGGREACAYEYWKKGKNGKYVTWIIWISDAPFKPTQITGRKFKNTTYINVGPAIPSGSFAKQESYNEIYPGMHPLSGVSGQSIELGHIFYLNNLDLGIKNTRLGIDWTIISATSLSTSSFSGDGNFNFYGMKIGPALSYYLGKNTIVDGFIKLNPVISNSSSVLNYGADSTSRQYIIEGSSLGLKKIIGANLRFSHGFVSLQYVFGGMNYNLSPYSGIINNYGDKIRLRTNNLVFSIGLCW